MGAGLVVMSDVSFESSLDVNDNLYVHRETYLDGDVSMGAGLVVMSDVSFEKSLDVSDNLYVHAKSYLDGDVSLGQSLYVAGDVSMESSLEVSNNIYVNNRLYSYSNTNNIDNYIIPDDYTSEYISKIEIYKSDLSYYTLDANQINAISDMSGYTINNDTDYSFNNDFLFDGSYVDYNSVTTLLVGGFSNIYSRMAIVEEVTNICGEQEFYSLNIPLNVTALGLMGIGTKDPSGGGLHIYETTGSTPEITLETSTDDNGNQTDSNHYEGSLILEHADINGTSGILFPSSRSSTSTEYGYIQWKDAIGTSNIDDYAKLIIGAKEATGNDLSQIIALMPTNGVGIMKDAPTRTLDVSGTFQATGNTTIGGTLGVSGATTLTGVLTANGGISGEVTGDLTGNAATATKISSIANDNIVLLTSSQTLSNKTLTTPIITSIKPTSSYTLTLPPATDTLVGKATTDTLTNKTLTEPDISGNMECTGNVTAVSFTANSDIKLKENIVALDDPLEKVLRLQGAEFNWKNDETKKKTVGFIAQEVEEVIPEVVHVGNDEIKSLNYNGVVPYLVESIKIQQQEITNQKQEITNQKQEITNQQTQINLLLERLTSLESKMA